MHDERVARAGKVRICVIGFTCKNRVAKMVKNAKRRSARVDYRVDISVTNGPIDKRQTRMCREMHGLAYAVSLDERRVARAVPMAHSVKICSFWAFFTIQAGALKVIDFKRCDKRSFAEQCTDFKMHRKHRLSFGHNML